MSGDDDWRVDLVRRTVLDLVVVSRWLERETEREGRREEDREIHIDKEVERDRGRERWTDGWSFIHSEDMRRER